MRVNARTITGGLLLLTLGLVATFLLRSEFGHHCGDRQALLPDTPMPPCLGKFTDDYAPPETPPPPLGQTNDGIYPGLTVTRVSSNDSLKTENGRARHQYSKRQVWNSNETRLVIASQVLDAATLEIVDDSIGLSASFNWSNLVPELLYGISYNPDPNVFGSYHIETKEFTEEYVFSDYQKCSLGHGEGNLSNDDRFALLTCVVSDTEGQHLVTFDRAENKVLGTLKADPKYNWAGFSQSGNYVVVENSVPGVPGRELIRYTPDLQESRLLSTYVEHGDLGVDEAGDDVYVMIGRENLTYVRLRDGQKVSIELGGLLGKWRSWNPGFGHVSCRNIHRPGWCYISTKKRKVVGAVRIGYPRPEFRSANRDGESVIRGYRALEHWGFHHSSDKDYNAQAKASVSPSGTKIIVTSDWDGRGEVNDYVIALEPL